ncbi:hypothetical protein I553_8755 [Mycobacterium xenopi 4042]|uniref:DUF5631 domain-containing protein n=1 Tax=Mycobacterium xenopi 4042 TaxID=1299334 RepID=X8CLJ0_MYCXE|nr:hypothetical protein I553_8755 [Mycobacterium xenopi 4042]
MAATEGIATGDRTSANYHFAWFQVLSAHRRAGSAPNPDRVTVGTRRPAQLRPGVVSHDRSATRGHELTLVAGGRDTGTVTGRAVGRS